MKNGIDFWSVYSEVVEDGTTLMNKSVISQNPVVAGRTEEIRCKASGGTGEYSYAVFSKKASESKWTTLQNYSKNSIVNFKSDEEGEYQICVKVRDGSGEIVKKYIDVEVKQGKDKGHTFGIVGGFNDWYEDIVMHEDSPGVYSGVVKDLDPERTYDFKVRADEDWDLNWGEYEEEYDSTFNSRTNCEIDVPECDYAVLFVTLDTTRVSAEALKNENSDVHSKDFNFYENGYYYWPVKYTLVVDDNKLRNTTKIVSEKVMVGNTVEIEASAAGGSGGYKYSALYKKTTDTKWATIQGFSENSKMSFKPSKVADYDVCVKVRDSNGTEKKKYFVVTVNDKLKDETTVEVISNNPYAEIEVCLDASGGSQDYEFRIEYKKSSDTKWKLVHDFDYWNYEIIRAASSVPYDVKISVRDSLGNTCENIHSNLQVNIPVKNNSNISLRHSAGATYVEVAESAYGGTGKALYYVAYKKATDTKWAVVQNYTARDEISIKLGGGNVYDIRVIAKDESGNISQLDYTVYKNLTSYLITPEEIENDDYLDNLEISSISDELDEEFYWYYDVSYDYSRVRLHEGMVIGKSEGYTTVIFSNESEKTILLDILVKEREA